MDIAIMSQQTNLVPPITGQALDPNPPIQNDDMQGSTADSNMVTVGRPGKFSPGVENSPEGGVSPLSAVTASKRFWMPLRVNGPTVKALVDTGNTLSYFGEKAGRLVLNHMIPHKISMRVANDQIT